jgi:hypothetical protein
MPLPRIRIRHATGALRRVSFEQWINISVLVVSIFAVVVSIVALKHADASGKEQAGILVSAEQAIETQTRVLNVASDSLRKERELLDAEVKTSKGQLNLLRAEDKRQLEISQRRPNLQFSLSCGEEPRYNPPHQSFAHVSLSWEQLDTDLHQSRIPEIAVWDVRNDRLPCRVRVVNSGTENARDVFFRWTIDRRYTVLNPAGMGRTMIIDDAGDVNLVEAKSEKPQGEGNRLEIARGVEIFTSALTASPAEFPFEVNFSRRISSFTLIWELGASNCQSVSRRVSIRLLTRPGPR